MNRNRIIEFHNGIHQAKKMGQIKVGHGEKCRKRTHAWKPPTEYKLNSQLFKIGRTRQEARTVIVVTRTDMLYIHCPKTSRWQSAGEFSSRRKYCLLSLDPSSP